jgi:erythritol kinase (D-erythritol 1-phosphate-forming)
MTERDLIIGIDAGTSVIKAVAFTTEGTQVAMASRPNSYSSPGPGHVEQDMVRTWADCAATLRELTDTIPGLADRVAALAVTGQGDGTWLIDADGEPVGGGLLWLDSRAAAICAAYMQTPAYADHYAATGSGLNACMASGQLAWMKRHQPERLARATTAFHCKDWLYFKLTGERVTDPSEATFTFGNFRTRAYETFILDAMGIRDCERLLPPIVDGSRQSHGLTGAAASITGLPEGLPVVLGFLDVACTAIGGGLVDPGAAVGLSVIGSTGMHMSYVSGPGEVKLNESRSGYTMVLPIAGAAIATQSNMAATLNVDWLVDMACAATELVGTKVPRATMLKALDAEVLEAAPASALYHPYIFEAGERGPFLDPNARAQFSALSTRTTLPGLMRAVYEGLAFAARDCYTASGPIPSEIRMGGGAARSRALRTILASVLDVPVRTVSREEAGAAGAAMTAAVCLGLYPDLPSCAQSWVLPLLGEATLPDPALVAGYARLFPIYQTIRTAMQPAWAALAAAREVMS